MTDLRERSIRTLAWLGDASFEKEVRWRIAHRGDYRADRLDAIKALVVCAESQARLLSEIEAELVDPEQDVVRRGRNAPVPATPRARRSTQDYREATAFEALLAYWELGGAAGMDRFQHLVSPRLDSAIDAAIEQKQRRLRRG